MSESKNKFTIKSKVGTLRPASTKDVTLWMAYAFHLEGYIQGLLEGIGALKRERDAKQK